jgi:glutaconate CoA-transferase, subunit B
VSLHPGETVADILAHTGFEFDIADELLETPPPDAGTLALIRGPVDQAIAHTYPAFAARELAIDPAA